MGYGPFTPAQLTVRGLKRSYTTDSYGTQEFVTLLNSSPPCYKLYLLGTHESDEKMEFVIASTAQPYLLYEALAAVPL